MKIFDYLNVAFISGFLRPGFFTEVFKDPRKGNVCSD